MVTKAVELSASAEWPRRIFTQVALYHRDLCIRALKAIANALAADCVEGRSEADENLLAFGLNVIATLLALDDHKSVTSILTKSKAVESLEIGLEAARLNDNLLLIDRVAPERLELVNAFLEKVVQRRSEILSAS